MKSRGQVGFEYLVFAAFLLGVSAILFAYAFVSYSTTIQNVQTQSAVEEVAVAADFVYAKGPGNAVIIDIHLPVGLTQFRVDQNVVRAQLTQIGGSSTLFSFTKSPITPNNLYFEEGYYSLRVSMGDVNVEVTNV